MSTSITIDADDCKLWLNDVYGNEWFVGCDISCEPTMEDGALFLEEFKVENIVLLGDDDRALFADSLATMPDMFPQVAVNGLESQIKSLMVEACFEEQEEQITESQAWRMSYFDRGGSDE
jgi:hypothetical protein